MSRFTLTLRPTLFVDPTQNEGKETLSLVFKVQLQFTHMINHLTNGCLSLVAQPASQDGRVSRVTLNFQLQFTGRQGSCWLDNSTEGVITYITQDI